MKRSTRKSIVQAIGFLALRVGHGLVLAVLVIFLYDIGTKGGGRDQLGVPDQPRRGSGMTEGGIFPAIFGTFLVTLDHGRPGRARWAWSRRSISTNMPGRAA